MKKYLIALILLSACCHSTDETEMKRFHKSHERFDKLNRNLEANIGHK